MISDSILGLNIPVGLLKELDVIAQTVSVSLRTQCFRSAAAVA